MPADPGQNPGQDVDHAPRTGEEKYGEWPNVMYPEIQTTVAAATWTEGDFVRSNDPAFEIG